MRILHPHPPGQAPVGWAAAPGRGLGVAGRQPLRVRRCDTVGGGPFRLLQGPSDKEPRTRPVVPLRSSLAAQASCEIKVLLQEACAVFAQKCIYLSVAGYVEFVEGPGN